MEGHCFCLFLTPADHWIINPDVTEGFSFTVKIQSDTLHTSSPGCVSSNCGKLKERLMWNFNIPVNRIWYFYWNRSTNMHCISHDFILDLRWQVSRCMDGTTFSIDFSHYRTPVVPWKCHVPWKSGICFHKFLWHRSTNRPKYSNEALQTWNSISGDSPFIM